LISSKSFASRHLVLQKPQELCERSCKSNIYVFGTPTNTFAASTATHIAKSAP
jgi:hypothetical protein